MGDRGGECEQGRVFAGWSDELDARAEGGADDLAGEGDDREAGQRDGRGVAEDRGAGVALIFGGDEAADWSAGKDEEV